MSESSTDEPEGVSKWVRACVAGSCAGLTEHFCLYPVDTVKTRMQVVLHSEVIITQSFMKTISQVK